MNKSQVLKALTRPLARLIHDTHIECTHFHDGIIYTLIEKQVFEELLSDGLIEEKPSHNYTPYPNYLISEKGRKELEREKSRQDLADRAGILDDGGAGWKKGL